MIRESDNSHKMIKERQSKDPTFVPDSRKNFKMSYWALLFFAISTIVGIYVGYLIQRPVSSLSDSIKCPFCYGTDLCEDVDAHRIKLRYNSFAEFFYNAFSVKNLFFAEFRGENVVLKKLGHEEELRRVQKSHHLSKSLLEAHRVKSFKTCEKEAFASFVQKMRGKFSLEQIWTVLQINVEPLMLTLLDGFPVPRLLGSCGFLVVESDCGSPLNSFENFPWKIRALLASQLLEAGIDFTHKHEDFRVYLTDISPDNVAVDENFTLRFVDLENVILKQKLQVDEGCHYSEFFPDDDFIYNEDEICQSPVSDHNIYAVCRLLLSRRAPWPMMPNGLLHSPPSHIVDMYKELFNLVEECVESEEKASRFNIADELIRLLRKAAE